MIKPSGRDSRVALKHFNWTATATDEADVKAEQQGKAVTSLARAWGKNHQP
jgi:hypothetical protein